MSGSSVPSDVCVSWLKIRCTRTYSHKIQVYLFPGVTCDFWQRLTWLNENVSSPVDLHQRKQAEWGEEEEEEKESKEKERRGMRVFALITIDQSL